MTSRIITKPVATLYDYGMYRFLRDDHSRGEAQALRIVHPWGRWLDPHACPDLTVLLFARKDRRSVVMAFSYSD